ncbi:hypothetical protein [Streptomyces sp. NRRL S-340]|uniref:hypothetical protein n=1 Tax=Streptomyces sp. NRRL S-340 TaxID=1463901 RepID=UPI000563CB95|nr:hypothetical protein [Streptomyces sp. NRRL S-340]
MPRSRWTERLGRLGLAALYFGVLTPIGRCVRAVRDPLRRSWDADRAGYLEPPAAAGQRRGAGPGDPRPGRARGLSGRRA